MLGNTNSVLFARLAENWYVREEKFCSHFFSRGWSYLAITQIARKIYAEQCTRIAKKIMGNNMYEDRKENAEQ